MKPECQITSLDGRATKDVAAAKGRSLSDLEAGNEARGAVAEEDAGGLGCEQRDGGRHPDGRKSAGAERKGDSRDGEGGTDLHLLASEPAMDSPKRTRKAAAHNRTSLGASVPEIRIPEESPGSVVYLGVVGDQLKAGFTSHLSQRMRSHRAADSGFRLVAYCAGNRNVEKRILTALSTWRTKTREWFQITPESLRCALGIYALGRSLCDSVRFERALQLKIYSVEEADRLEQDEAEKEEAHQSWLREQWELNRVNCVHEKAALEPGETTTLKSWSLRVPDNHRRFRTDCRCEFCLLVSCRYKIVPADSINEMEEYAAGGDE
jgi:hypothetical protein